MPPPEPFTFDGAGEARRSAPHVARNVDAIIDVLRDILPNEGTVLEVASGTGEHIVHFARAFPQLLWQPTDTDPIALRSVNAWRTSASTPNLLAPMPLDASAGDWPVERVDAILCINMVHISAWAATEGLMRAAGQLLATGAPLYLYGAYRQAGVPTAPSNEAFDRSLRARNPDWGLRDLERVVDEAASHGLELERVVPMPANNISVIFRRG